MLLGLVALAWAGVPQLLPTMRLAVGDNIVSVEVADDDSERRLGLMFRESLVADAGMLFVYPDEAPRSFWMKNTSLPLSIAFINQQGRIMQLSDMTPFETRPVPCRTPVMYALEMNQGWFMAHNVGVGDTIGGLPGPSAD